MSNEEQASWEKLSFLTSQSEYHSSIQPTYGQSWGASLIRLIDDGCKTVRGTIAWLHESPCVDFFHLSFYLSIHVVILGHYELMLTCWTDAAGSCARSLSWCHEKQFNKILFQGVRNYRARNWTNVKDLFVLGLHRPGRLNESTAHVKTTITLFVYWEVRLSSLHRQYARRLFLVT